MSVSTLRLPQSLQDKDLVGFFEDWESNYVTGDRWSPLTSDSSSASTLVLVLKNTGSARGILSITQDATANDEIYFTTTVAPFLIAANKPMYYEHRMQFSEAATNDMSAAFGFLSTASGSLANSIIDTTGLPVASATMALIYKHTGSTVWKCRSQIGAAVGQTDSTSTTTAGGSAYQTLGIEVIPYSSTNAWVVYTVDGVALRDSNNLAIKHDLVYTNAVTCGAFFGTKTVGGNAEVLLSDYVAAYQTR